MYVITSSAIREHCSRSCKWRYSSETWTCFPRPRQPWCVLQQEVIHTSLEIYLWWRCGAEICQMNDWIVSTSVTEHVLMAAWCVRMIYTFIIKFDNDIWWNCLEKKSGHFVNITFILVHFSKCFKTKPPQKYCETPLAFLNICVVAWLCTWYVLLYT